MTLETEMHLSETLTEQRIKEITLGYLKKQYDVRPRFKEEYSSLKALFDQRTEEGYIADGYISYKKEDGMPFVATFEATSVESASREVFFKLKASDLHFDAIVFGLFSSAITTAILWGGDFWLKLSPIWLFNLLTTTFLGFLGYTLFKNLMVGATRYRKIFAIEQFKTYNADEQWVAISKDVFPDGAANPYYVELYKQCRDNGFGLLIVFDAEGRLEVRMSPSREQVLKKRKTKNFFAENVGNAVGNSANAIEKLTNRPSTLQVSVAAVSILFMVTAFGKRSQMTATMNDTQAVTMEEKIAQDTIFEDNNKKDIGVEDNSYVVEADKIQKIDKNALPFDFETYTESKNAVLPEQKTVLSEEQIGAYYFDEAEKKYMFRDCARTDDGKDKYVVQDSYIENLEDAKRRVRQLNNLGFVASFTSISCFPHSAKKMGYVIHFGDALHDDAESAHIHGRRVIRQLEEMGITHAKDIIKVRILKR